MSTFTGEMEVRVLKSGREIARVLRPLRQTSHGPAVKFKRRLWLVNGDSINVDGAALDDEESAETPQAEMPEAWSQDDVTLADPSRRILVDAGPGTGKTYVACGRVAHLIREGIRPGRIWIVSFTRTAVHEIRNRLTGQLDNPADAIPVRIATLDSHAWALQSGFSSEAALTGSFDDNIEATINRIETNDELRGYLLDKVSHLIVDEAQDIVGSRAALVQALIDALAPECGVTVFADRAQAIYGFTEDSGSADELGLLDDLTDFEHAWLSEVRRTSDPGLVTIFTDVRRDVLNDNEPPAVRGPRIRGEIQRLSGNDAGKAAQIKLQGLDAGTLVLMRRRCDVLVAANFGQDVPHRLRMSGLPPRIYPWVGELLWDFTGRKLTRSVFERRWTDQVTTVRSEGGMQQAWNLLVETAGETEAVVDIHQLRRILGRRNPPALFISPEYGDAGPILGTIHASKGREANDVHLYLPPEGEEEDDEADLAEEIRVMFVGATRARNRLFVGQSSARGAASINGRVWRKASGGIQFEVGRAEDIDASGLTGRIAFATAEDAVAAQRFLIANPILTKLYAQASGDLDWRMPVRTDAEKQRICVLSKALNEDLYAVARFCEKRVAPQYLPYIRSMGLRSLVVPPSDHSLEKLHEPWRESGIMMAPMLTGLCKTTFPGNA